MLYQSYYSGEVQVMIVELSKEQLWLLVNALETQMREYGWKQYDGTEAEKNKARKYKELMERLEQLAND
jgi:hypothetical protein